MGATAAVHPNDQTLQAYSLGKLDEASAESVNKHLSSCSECEGRVAGMSPDSFLGRLREARGGPEMSATDRSQFGASLLGQRAATAVAPPATETLPPGLADHPDYEIKQELGRGGMGVVYLAHNRLMGRDEVLKVMGRHIMERPGVLERFLREIRAVAKLRHSNIVTAYHATRIGESFVLAMEYVEGQDLSRTVKAKGALPVAHACFFAHQAALGLQHAHEEGLVHRDMKPGNLMLSYKKNKSTVKILDFGLARVTREEKVDLRLTSEGQALGTPDYIAPEQIVDATTADIRADIYSLGGTLYHLLTGRPPFQASSLYDMYQAHMSRDADPLNFVRPEVPAELAALVAKMMAKDVGRRFQDPREVAEALGPFFRNVGAAFRGSQLEVSRADKPGVNQGAAGAGSASTHPVTARTSVHESSRQTPAPPAPSEAEWESLVEFRHPRGSPDVNSTATQPKRRRSVKFWPLVATAFGTVALSLGIVIYVVTNKGRIKIDVDDPNAVVLIDEKHVTIEGLGQPITLTIGEHELKIKRGNSEFRARKFSIRGGDNERLIVAALIPPFPAEMPSAKVGGMVGGPGAHDQPSAGRELGGMARSDAGPSSKNGTSTFPGIGAPALDPARFFRLGAQWNVDGDELVQTDLAVQGLGLALGDERWTDYDFTVDAMRVGGNDCFIMGFRCTTEQQWNGFSFTVAGYGNRLCSVELNDNGKRRYLKGVNGKILDDRWYTARVRARGTHFQVFFGDRAKEDKLFEIVSSNHSKGRVVLATWGSSYRFKNIKVTAPDGTLLWEGPPDLDSPRAAGLTDHGTMRMLDGGMTTGGAAAKEAAPTTGGLGGVTGGGMNEGRAMGGGGMSGGMTGSGQTAADMFSGGMATMPGGGDSNEAASPGPEMGGMIGGRMGSAGTRVAQGTRDTGLNAFRPKLTPRDVRAWRIGDSRLLSFNKDELTLAAGRDYINFLVTARSDYVNSLIKIEIAASRGTDAFLVLRRAAERHLGRSNVEGFRRSRKDHGGAQRLTFRQSGNVWGTQDFCPRRVHRN